MGKYPYSSISGGILCKNCSTVIDNKQIDSGVFEILLKSEAENPHSQNIQVEPTNIRAALELLREHLDIRAKNKIKSFDLVFSL